MELSSSNIKKFLILPEMELFSSKIKKCLIFLEINFSFFIFRETKTMKKFFMSQETGLFYISGNGNRKNELHFKKSNEKKKCSKNEKKVL